MKTIQHFTTALIALMPAARGFTHVNTEIPGQARRLGNETRTSRTPALHCMVALAGLIFAAAQVRAACISPPTGMVAWWSGDGNTTDIGTWQ